MFAQDVRSMVAKEECEKLAAIAKDALVLELGTFAGRSTIALASVAREVHTVDWHKGDQHSGSYDSLPEFVSNLQRYNLLAKIVAYVGKNEDVLPALRHLYSFDVAFIDSDHSLEAVERDIRLTRPLIRAGGIIAFHDYGEIPGLTPGFKFGVTEAVDEFVRREKASVEVVRTLAVVQLS